jgi:hypothetical protein
MDPDTAYELRREALRYPELFTDAERQRLGANKPNIPIEVRP